MPLSAFPGRNLFGGLMHLAEFIDICRGRERMKATAGLQPETLLEAMMLARLAEAFDFGQLPLEADSARNFRVPRLTIGEWTMYREGVLPFPAPLCWFEFRLETASGLLIDTRDPEHIDVQRFDFGKSQDGLDELPVGIWARIDYADILAPDRPATADHRVTIWSHDPKMKTMIKSVPQASLLELFGHIPQLAFYMNLMLNSRSTEIKNCVPPERLNKARERRGATPLPPHRVVTIVPYRFVDVGLVKGADGVERRAPRIHWRRSHIRHQDHQTERSKWAPDHEYKGKTGWHLIPIPRFLVAKKADSEITHEYRLSK
jgi:hypothetical protein